jgi:hypothetical protein
MEQAERIRHFNEILGVWHGSNAQLWSFSASLATLEIRLFDGGTSGNLLLVCSPCVSISGPVYWERCDLCVRDEATDGGLLIVEDKRSSVRIVCRQLQVFESDDHHFFVPEMGIKGAAAST